MIGTGYVSLIHRRLYGEARSPRGIRPTVLTNRYKLGRPMALPPNKPRRKDARSSTVGDNRFVDSVRTAIEDNLIGADLTIDVCAEQLRISRRTMQRLLAEVGLTFTSLLDQVRLETAARLLTDENASVAEIANHLGYTHSANFARAFQRLTGVTPTEYRRRLR